ncbi:MAG: thioredoxin [Elusimicrobiota bacterium]|nr:thioredoxin [Elusimicrobiota bacterium]
MLIDKKSEGILRDKFEKDLKKDVEVKVFSRNVLLAGENIEYARFGENLVKELSGISGKIKPVFLSLADEEAKNLALSVSPTVIVKNSSALVEFAGAPVSYQSGVLIEVISSVGAGVSGLGAGDKDKLKNIDRDVSLDVFVAAESSHDVQMSLAACKIAVETGGRVKTRIVEISQSPDIAGGLGVTSAPCVVINGDKNLSYAGFLAEDKMVNLVLKHGSSKADEILAAEEKEAKRREKLEDNPGYPVVLTDGNFDKAVKKYPFIVIDCWAEWCGPCRMVHPIVESLAKKRKGEIVFGKLNVDENRMISGRYGIMSIPTLLVFKNGEKAGSVVGAMPEATLEAKINAYK